MPLIWTVLFFLCGIIAGRIFPLAWQMWMFAALAALFLLVLFFLFIKRLNARWEWLAHARAFHFALPIFFLLGAAWSQFRQPNFADPFFIGFYNDRAYEVLVTGTLAEPPDERDSYTNLSVRVEAVDTGSGDMPVSGLILARVEPNRPFEYGQRLRLRGTLITPPVSEEFSYRDYLAEQGVHSMMKNAAVTTLPGYGGNLFLRGVYAFKNNMLRNIYKIFHDPQASLFAGILLGVDSGLTRSLQQAFKDTGTAHIIAISGFNIAIIAGIFYNFFKTLFKEKLGATLAILGIFLYAFLVGMDAAVFRAALMGSLGLFARQTGRRNLGLNGLAFSAMVMALLNPLVLWNIGFQLSALATLGLILYAEPFSNLTAALLSKIFKGDLSSFTRFINDNVILTFAAQLATLPVMVYHFKQFSFIAFIANPLILFVQPAVMILGGLAALLSLVIFPLGQALAWVAEPFAIYTIRVVEIFSQMKTGIYYVPNYSLTWTALTYAALFGVTAGWSALAEWIRARRASLRGMAFSAALTLLFICSMLLWRSVSAAGDGQLHITFLDVGSANAILIKTPDGRNVLINGGAQASQLSDQLGRRLPFFRKKIDWLVVASSDEDELAALPRVMRYYPPQNVLWSGNLQASFAAQQLDKLLAEQGVAVTQVEAGQKLDLGQTAVLQIFSASGRGATILVEYKNFRAWLPISPDVDFYSTHKEIGKVDLALLADSGYLPSNPPDAILNLNPQLLILSVSAGDANGLPDPALLQALEGYSLLRTDRNGWISIVTDGETMRVEAARGD
ncbi:MAG: hypothetical protein Fur002_25650 [Anaerolineales bacterium]